MTNRAIPGDWLIARHRISIDVYWLPAIWGVFVLLVALTGAIFTAAMTTSLWEKASALPRWFMGATGVYSSAVYLPLYIAHGFTRRQFMRELPVFLAASVTAAALLMTAGYALESVVYGFFGWPHVISGTHLFERPTEFHLIATEFWLVYSVWTTVGAMVGAAFYRNGLLGAASLPVAIAMLGLAEGTVGTDARVPLALLLPAVREAPLATVVAVCAGLVALGLAATWAIVRTMPVRGKKA